jgi:nucleotide-binding universal stress UspA family protein
MTACHDTSAWGPSTGVRQTHFRRIVVGVDGTPNSIAALRVAVGLAVTDDAVVEAVCAYHPYLESEYVFAGPAGPMDAATDAEVTLMNAVSAAFGRAAVDRLTLRAIEGDPPAVLSGAAATADLLVVGARRHGRLLGLLHGSTAQACTRHATGPVLVVPASEAAPR